MRVIHKKEAKCLITDNPERTIHIEILNEQQHGYRMLNLVSCIETREQSVDYPEELCLNLYGNGSGWKIPINVFLKRNGKTLNDKLSEEMGHHCGGIDLVAENVIETYINGCFTYISGTDEEIQQVIPHLRCGSYIFIFDDTSLL